MSEELGNPAELPIEDDLAGTLGDGDAVALPDVPLADDPSALITPAVPASAMPAPLAESAKTANMPQADPARPTSQTIQWAVVGVVLGATLVVGAALAAMLVPRWWASVIAAITGGDVFASGFWGVTFGLVLTVASLWLMIRTIRRRWQSWQAPLVVWICAALLAAPNVFVVWIVWGNTAGARDGRATLAASAPHFAWGTAWGVLSALVLVIVADVMLRRMRRHRRELKEFKRQVKERG
ncbi:MAG: hypothetical protein FWD83_06495 [Promicromonosporaceae bacterium]|nr:hypothetical protein [Promicromonosporaceae bacterium]